MRIVTTAGFWLLMGLTATAIAQDPGTVVEWANMKSTAPAGWKKETPTDKLGLRKAQFKLPKAEGDKDDAEVVVFYTPGGGGVEANLKRQLDTFAPAKGADKVDSTREKIQVGKYNAVYLDIKGTFLKKPFPMAKESTPFPDYRQIYVVFEDESGAVASVWLRGPAKTVEKHKKDFDAWVKNFK